MYFKMIYFCLILPSCRCGVYALVGLTV